MKGTCTSLTNEQLAAYDKLTNLLSNDIVGQKEFLKLLKSYPTWIEPCYDFMQKASNEKNGEHLLHALALSTGNNKEAAILAKPLAKSKTNVQHRNGRGFTPLHCAALLANIELMELLIFSGALVNSLTDDKLAPLNLALRRNSEKPLEPSQIKAANLLLYYGANPLTLNPSFIDLNKAFFKDPKLFELKVFFDIIRDNPGLLSKYCTYQEENIDLNNTPLHFCAATTMSTPEDWIKLVNSANLTELVNTQNISGNTPLHEATEANNHIAAGYLLENNANTTISNKDGHTPGYIALSLGRINILKVFDKCRALDITDLGKKDIYGKTPLHHIASRGHNPDLYDYLLSIIINNLNPNTYKEFANTTDADGNAPLHYAYAQDNENLKEFLLALGADSEIKNKLNMPPFQYKQYIAENNRKTREFENFMERKGRTLFTNKFGPESFRINSDYFLYDAGGNGNCFFLSLRHQLALQNHPDKNLNDEELRSKIIPGTGRFDWVDDGNYDFKESLLKAYPNTVLMVATLGEHHIGKNLVAYYLNGKGEMKIDVEYNSSSQAQFIIRLAFLDDNHVVSVVGFLGNKHRYFADLAKVEETVRACNATVDSRTDQPFPTQHTAVTMPPLATITRNATISTYLYETTTSCWPCLKGTANIIISFIAPKTNHVGALNNRSETLLTDKQKAI